ncbi:transposase [Pedobacter sp. SD-b]|uniref:Transposase n=1 Tax=Pedobacter segetis TaxID=2793069 RepID=A0ABS1BJX3_9SPHI|nr:transposase [Pedobacter segetis]
MFCQIKYRLKVLIEEVSETLKAVCIQLSSIYEIHFLEIGYDEDHVHFLIQSVAYYFSKKDSKHVKEFDS